MTSHGRRIRLAGLLASSSVAALLIGGGAPAFAACYTGPFAGGYNNTGAASCITVNNTSFTGNLSNTGTIGPAATGIAVINSSTITGVIFDSGVINATSHGILIDSSSKVIFASPTAPIRISGPSFSGGISNAGTISGVDGIIVMASTFTGGISNSGTVTANAGAAGIWILGTSTFTGGINNSGTIAAGGVHGDAIEIQSVSTFAGGISNAGTISTAGTYGIVVVKASTFSGGISNGGTISGTSRIAVAAALVSTFTGGISNSGMISSRQSGIDASQIHQFGSSTGGGISNSGTISAASSGILVYTDSTFSGGIGNSGKIVGGLNAIAVKTVAAFTGGIGNSGSLSNSNIAFSVVTVSEITTFSGGITNSGTISGGNAIGVVFISTFSGGITNSGTISAAGHTGIYVSHISAFSGNISNAGSITAATGIKIRAGNGFVGGATIVNTGTIIATGAAINASIATSAVTIDQNAGSIAGSILLPTAAGVVGTLNVFGGTFNGNVTGGGTTGSDVVNFAPVNGSFAYAGTISGVNAVNINSGTLFDGGAITAAGVVVNSGATLAPGTPGVPGTSMTINGNLAFQSGAAYLVTLNPATASFASVSGAATLNGTVQATFAPGSYISKQYTILTAGSISGKFAALANSNLPSNFHDQLSYDASHAYLDLTLNFTPPAGGGQNNNGGNATPNASAPQASSLPGNPNNVANALINSFNTAGGIPTKFATLPASALTALDGEAGTGAGKGTAQLMTDFLALMLDPTAAGGGRMTGGGADGFAPEQDASLPADVALAYAKALKAPAPTQLSPTSGGGSGWGNFDQHWSAWGSGFGGTSHIDGNAALGTNNVTASDYGFAAGIESHAAPGLTYGFGLAGGGTNWNLAQALGSGRSDSFQAGMYAKTHAGPFYFSGALALANHWFTTDRIALGDQLQAKFTGQSYAARGEAGYRYAVPITGAIIGVTPYAALQAQSFHTPGYSETDLTGGGFGLSYGSASATDTRGELGARFDNLQIVYGMPLVLRGRLAWAHDWTTNAAALNAAFQALPASSFTVNGAAQPQNSALTTAAAELQITPSWTAIAKFDGEFAQGAQTYGGTGTLKYAW